MPFKKNDPATIAAGSKGGKSGIKYFAAMSPEEIKAWNSEMGKRSAIARRQRAEEDKNATIPKR